MLIEAVESYLQLRRATGFDLRHDTLLLRNYARYASARGEMHVLSQTAIEWSGMATSLGGRERRLRAVARFSRHVYAEDAAHEIPPIGIYGKHRQRRTPFIFTSIEISNLLEQARALGPAGSLRPHTYATLFALLSATGLRVSEALNLNLKDLTPDGLLIRETKFKKSRLVPLHETTMHGIQDYQLRRQQLVPSDDYLFVSLRGHRLCYESVRSVFHRLTKQAGIDRHAQGRPPQIHSFRHTFAVRALEGCRCDRDYVDRHLVALSTYLGHTHVADTYWYLEATPQLLGDIAAAWETFVKGGTQ